MVGDSSVLEQLDHIMEFQLNDLRKTSVEAKANFLVAVGCMNTIEFFGGVRNGLLGVKGNVERRFKEGVHLLGGEYNIDFGQDRMYSLRNGLTHQYLPSLKGFAHILVANDWSADKAILQEGEKIALNVAKLVIDLGFAWGRLRCELLNNEQMRKEAGEALTRLPKLM